MSEQTPAATQPTDAAADATTGNATDTVAAPAPATEAKEAPAQDATKPEGDQKPAPKAPEKYEFQAPEGREFEAETLGEFENVCRELDLTQDQATKFIPIAGKFAERIAAKQAEAHKAQVERWAEEARADKEIGGDKLEASVASARKAIGRFGSPQLKELLDTTGLGNHPEFVRAFQRIGDAIAEDRFVNAPSGGGSHKSAAEVLYDHPTSRK